MTGKCPETMTAGSGTKPQQEKMKPRLRTRKLAEVGERALGEVLIIKLRQIRTPARGELRTLHGETLLCLMSRRPIGMKKDPEAGAEVKGGKEARGEIGEGEEAAGSVGKKDTLLRTALLRKKILVLSVDRKDI